MIEPLLAVEQQRVHFTLPGDGLIWPGKKILKAVDGISFSLNPGETLGVVGESGCGKSTLARGILGLVPVTSGSIKLNGVELTELSRAEMREQRRIMQVIFQDPLASLNPRMTVGEIIAEPLKVYNPDMSAKDLKQQVASMMDRVGLLPNLINRYPHEFSGGQCQRIGIARALILKPKLLICDEPVSALDVSIQAQIINLLMELQQEFGLAMMFIAHDLSVVKHISHRVMVMYLGKVVEMATREELYKNPKHPYTRALIDSIPLPDPELERNKKINTLEGDLPSPLAPPSGCAFRTRCPKAHQRCKEAMPGLEIFDTNHEVACWDPN